MIFCYADGLQIWKKIITLILDISMYIILIKYIQEIIIFMLVFILDSHINTNQLHVISLFLNYQTDFKLINACRIIIISYLYWNNIVIWVIVFISVFVWFLNVSIWPQWYNLVSHFLGYRVNIKKYQRISYWF